MTPARPAPERLDTPTKIAEAADENLIERNLSVPSSVYAVQSTMGKKWTLSGREKDKRALWKWFSGQLRATFLSLHTCFRPLLAVDDSLIPTGTVFSRVANSHLYMVLLQLTSGTARIIIETQVDFETQDGHRALVALAEFYAPMNDGRVDELTFKIMNVYIGAREDPQPIMLQLQAYREEFFVASGVERDEARLTADLNNSLGEEHQVALSMYNQNPMMNLSVLQNCVQQSWRRAEKNSLRIATGRMGQLTAAPAMMERTQRSPPRPHKSPPRPPPHGGRGGGRGGYQEPRSPAGPKGHVKTVPHPDYECMLCRRKGHWVSNCPLMQQASRMVATPPSGPPPAPARLPPPRSPPPPASKPRAYAARFADDDDGEQDDDDDDDEGFGGEYLPLVALAGVGGGARRETDRGFGTCRDQRASKTRKTYGAFTAESRVVRPRRRRKERTSAAR
jgi:hypothetical protein